MSERCCYQELKGLNHNTPLIRPSMTALAVKCGAVLPTLSIPFRGVCMVLLVKAVALADDRGAIGLKGIPWNPCIAAW